MSEINDTKEQTEGTFPINLKFIQEYQRSEPSIIAKYKIGTYQKVFFSGGINIDLKLKCVKIRLLFHKNSKVTYCIGTIRISFIQE